MKSELTRGTNGRGVSSLGLTRRLGEAPEGARRGASPDQLLPTPLGQMRSVMMPVPGWPGFDS
jgi:hypothetical protein